jgi:hypothetical protein
LCVAESNYQDREETFANLARNLIPRETNQMIGLLLAVLAWCSASFAIGGMMIWRPIPFRKARAESKHFQNYVLN